MRVSISRWIVASALLVPWLTAGTPALAQYTINTLASFNVTNTNDPDTDGYLTLSGNTLYGTNIEGGTNGVGDVFSIPVTGGTPTILASFNGTNGANPLAGLTLSGNTLYGTTDAGGANGDGTIFSITIPEPGSISLLGIASLGLLRGRRKSAERFLP